MAVVAYVPPNEKPQDLAFFRYGCCVSTTQALWMVIGTFALAVALLVICCFSAIFVRWVYKRRMRKKLEGLKDKYRQEEKFKKEVELNLKEIAKRPIIKPQRNDYVRNLERSLEQLSTVNVHGMSVPFPVSRPSVTNINQPSTTTAIGQQAPALKTDAGGVVFTAPTITGVVHQMALADTSVINKNSQPPFPGVAIKQNVNRSKEETKLESPVVKVRTSKEQDETVEKKKQEREKNQEREKKPSPKKEEGGNGRKKRAVAEEGTVFPYYAGNEQETEGETTEDKDKTGKREKGVSKRKSAETDAKTGSTQSSPVTSNSRKSPMASANQDPTYSVYHLRRIAEEQRRVAETERATEMLGQRQTTEEKRGLNHEELGRLMKGERAEKQTAAVIQAKDVPNNEDSPSRR